VPGEVACPISSIKAKITDGPLHLMMSTTLLSDSRSAVARPPACRVSNFGSRARSSDFQDDGRFAAPKRRCAGVLCPRCGEIP
jgi:hypothetical protein